MARYFVGNLGDSEGLRVVSEGLESLVGGFSLGVFAHPFFADLKYALAQVFSGSGELSIGDSRYVLRENDVLLCAKDSARIKSEDGLRLFVIYGEDIWSTTELISDSSVPIEESPIGGQRKTPKRYDLANRVDVHTIWVDDANRKKPHYHEVLTELYLVREGKGRMLLQDLRTHPYEGKASYSDEVALSHGSIVVVPPYMIHRAVHSDSESMRIHVFGLPNFVPKDVVFVSE